MQHHDPFLSPGALLLAEILSGGAVAHFVTHLPGWVGGGISALAVGIILRLLDAPLRRASDRLAGTPRTPRD